VRGRRLPVWTMARPWRCVLLTLRSSIAQWMLADVKGGVKAAFP